MAARIQVPVLMLSHMIPAADTPEQEQLCVDDIRVGSYQAKIIVGRELNQDRLPLDRTEIK